MDMTRPGPHSSMLFVLSHSQHTDMNQQGVAWVSLHLCNSHDTLTAEERGLHLDKCGSSAATTLKVVMNWHLMFTLQVMFTDRY
jgi:hypothetical protein